MTEKVDLLAIHGAGARVKPEKSNALRSFQYGDPANNVKFERERCGGCKYERVIQAGTHIGVGLCQKKNEDGSKRLYGTRCDDFREKGSK